MNKIPLHWWLRCLLAGALIVLLIGFGVATTSAKQVMVNPGLLQVSPCVLSVRSIDASPHEANASTDQLGQCPQDKL